MTAEVGGKYRGDGIGELDWTARGGDAEGEPPGWPRNPALDIVGDNGMGGPGPCLGAGVGTEEEERVGTEEEDRVGTEEEEELSFPDESRLLSL